MAEFVDTIGIPMMNACIAYGIVTLSTRDGRTVCTLTDQETGDTADYMLACVDGGSPLERVWKRV